MLEKIVGRVLHDNRKLFLLPNIFLLFSLIVLGMQFYRTGSPLIMGIDFRGGTHLSAMVEGEVNVPQLESLALERLGADVNVRTAKDSSGRTTILIESKKQLEKSDMKAILEKAGVAYDEKEFGVNTVGAALSDSFYLQAKLAIVFAVILMAVVVLLTFKTFVPSAAVVICGISDTLFAMAMMNVTGIELSLGTLAALLMLIGSSVDTDILLTTRLLKRKDEGTFEERVSSSIRTGETMTFTGMTAFIVLYLVSTSKVLDQIALVMIFGMVADLVNTWFQNVGLLKMYMEKKGELEAEKKPEESRLRMSFKKRRGGR